MTRLGAVVIGRNEGEKLAHCLASVVRKVAPVVYVDSGSSDDSVAVARRAGADVVELDRATPFTVARARNEGFARLLALDPQVELVQFVDGDSQIVESWFARGAEAFAAEPRCAIACGLIRERSSDRSIYARLYRLYNDVRLSDPGLARGISMMRVEAFRQVEGFVPWLVGAEDREISLRMRRGGWQIRRIEADMALHEAGMDSFDQWWRRRQMNGRSLCQQAALGPPLDRGVARRWLSAVFWGIGLPAIALTPALSSGGVSLLLFLAYPLLALRVYRRLRALGFAPADARLYAMDSVAEKFPKALGIARYYLRERWRPPRAGARA